LHREVLETSGGLSSQLAGGLLFLESFYVGDYVLDLRGFQRFLERRHELIAVFNPFLKILVGNFIVVHGECSALGNSLKAGTNFFLIVIGVMA
jgi:hypothetical protein